jgi:O-antigen/teichoic acid export membrane protein
MSSLKLKVISNVVWNLAEQMFTKGFAIVTTIVLAWFLVPEDYALVAMLTVFISLSTALVDAGLGQALIRQLKVSKLDLNTVFYTNLGLSIFLYFLLYGLAPLIADFYSEERLIDLIRVVSLSIFFQAFIVIQKTVLTRALNFKLQLRAVLPAAILSSILAVLLAYLGYGVWALIFQILFNSVFLAIFYWLLKLWRPSFQFSFLTLKSLSKDLKKLANEINFSLPSI